MLTIAKVIATEGKVATVEVKRKSACEGCHKMTLGEGCGVCSLLGSDSRFEAKAENGLGARVGDRVEVETGTGRVLFYSALVFLLPVVVGILLYGVSGWFFETELARYLLLAGGFAVSLFGVWLYSHFVIAKRLDARIVRICPAEESSEHTDQQ